MTLRKHSAPCSISQVKELFSHNHSTITHTNIQQLPFILAFTQLLVAPRTNPNQFPLEGFFPSGNIQHNCCHYIINVGRNTC